MKNLMAGISLLILILGMTICIVISNWIGAIVLAIILAVVGEYLDEYE